MFVGIHDEGWSIDAEFDFMQQYTGWRSNNLPIPEMQGKRSFPVEYHGMRKGDLVYFVPQEATPKSLNLTELVVYKKMPQSQFVP